VKILLVEDNELTALFLYLLLTERGLVVRRFSTAAGVLDAVDGSDPPFDAAVVDVQLKDHINGVELLERLRALPGSSRLPVVVITAGVLDELDKERVGRCGNAVVLSKPFEPDALLGVLSTLVGNGYSKPQGHVGQSIGPAKDKRREGVGEGAIPPGENPQGGVERTGAEG
jgi:DNA-binding response OmpR family regulator